MDELVLVIQFTTLPPILCLNTLIYKFTPLTFSLYLTSTFYFHLNCFLTLTHYLLRHSRIFIISILTVYNLLGS